MTQAAQLAQYGSNNVGLSFKNRIINGDMSIDQRNAGASISIPNATESYPVDRFVGYKDAGSITAGQSSVAPTGFSNSLLWSVVTGATATSGQLFFLRQSIEGFNTADLSFGTANAQTVTLSFWVRSSLTGTFSGAIANSAVTRCYAFTYTISAANTWEQKSITITGDTTGTWIGATNGTGLRVYWDLGNGSTFRTSAGSWQTGAFLGAIGTTSVSATTGATFYITGVQLEKGSVATSFDYLPYGTELLLCQRYYEVAATTGNYASVVCSCFNAADAYCQIQFKVQKRTSASVSISAFGNWAFYSGGSQRTINAIQTQNPSDTTFQVKISSANTFTSGQAAHLDFNPTITAANGGGWTAAAEL